MFEENVPGRGKNNLNFFASYSKNANTPGLFIAALRTMESMHLRKLKHKYRYGLIHHEESELGEKGGVLPPLLMYLVGVPASVCLLLWLIFF